MSEQLLESIQKSQGENYELHARYINPQFAKVLNTIGLDKVYTKAFGPYLIDHHNVKYLDFLSGYGVFNIGRNHPKIKSVLKKHIDEDQANLIQMEAPLLSGLLAKRLLEIANQSQLQKVYFTNSGTESIETAIKFVRCATGKKRILFLKKAFHGLSTGSLALNGGGEFREGFGDLLSGCDVVEQNNLEQLEIELKKNDVAAFFFESIQGKGVHIPNDLYLPNAFKLCQKYKTLFVADEVQTGLGRTGKWFAYEHWNLKPDVVCISKALSGGMVPVGAVLYGDEIYKKVFSRMDRCVVHSSTFGQNNLAMICGLATIDIIKDENLIENANTIGKFLLEGLSNLKQKHQWLKDVRGKGLMIGIEFGEPQSIKNKLKWKMIHQMDKGLFAELIVMPMFSNHHFLTQVSGHHQDIIKIIPPLVINKEHALEFIKALDSVLEDCGKISGPVWEMSKNLIKHSLADKKAG